MTTSQVWFRAGAEELLRYGTLTRRLAPPTRGGERWLESFSNPNGAQTFIGRDGLIYHAGANILRAPHFPLWPTLQPTMLLEQGRTNGWTKSEQLDDAAWIKTGATITATNVLAPDGTLTADVLTESALNEFHYFSRTTPTLTDNTLSTVSLFCRSSTDSRWFRFVTVDKSNVQRSTWFNPGTGVIGTKDAGHVAFVQGPFPGPGGTPYYRFGVSFNASAGAFTPIIQFIMATADNGGQYLGDGTGALVFWGVQFEADSPTMSSYIRTTTVPFTRSADSLTFPWPYKPQVGWFYIKFIELGNINANAAGLFSLSTTESSADETLVIRSALGGGAYNLFHGVDGAAVGASVSGASVGQIIELLGLLNADGSVTLRQSIAGGPDLVSGPSASTPFGASWPVLRFNGANNYWTNIGQQGLISFKAGPGAAVNTIALARAA